MDRDTRGEGTWSKKNRKYCRREDQRRTLESLDPEEEKEEKRETEKEKKNGVQGDTTETRKKRD